MFQLFVDQMLSLSSQMGYGGIIFLMAVESSFIPFPSEVVIPPAAYLSSQGEMNLAIIIICGTVGSLIGALFNYWLAYYLGPKIIYMLSDHRLAKYFLINRKKIEQSEQFFLKYSNVSTLIGRFVPGVRQLISIPAGFSRMPLGNFLLFTTVGSGLWVTILALLGYYFGSNQEIIQRYYKELSWFLLAVGIITGGIIWKNYKKRKNKD